MKDHDRTEGVSHQLLEEVDHLRRSLVGAVGIDVHVIARRQSMAADTADASAGEE
ncbi:MAG TPA: hypothetical protein VGL49_00785 [Acidimicrobiales bacterium]